MADETLGGVDPGEAFDPGAAPAAPMLETKPAEEIKPVTVARVKKALLKGTGFMHSAAGERVKANLTMNDREADLIAPGVARYINARPALLAGVAVGGDEYLQAIVGGCMYTGRIWFERAAALQTDAAAAQLDEAGGEELPADVPLVFAPTQAGPAGPIIDASQPLDGTPA